MSKKSETAQSELFDTDVSWFHIFKELIRSKVWADLTPVTAKLYCVVKAFVNWEDGAAFPSIDKLQEYSGLARASVMKGLRELEEKGLLKRDSRRGVGSNYQLVELFQVTDQSGRPAASVSFDYMPTYVSDAVAELKNFVANGLTVDGKTQFIKIENLTLNIVRGDQYNQTLDTQIMLKGLRDVLEQKDTPEANAVKALAAPNEAKPT
jgi:DNA-binding transcriptional regulator GbsR (MarR family)